MYKIHKEFVLIQSSCTEEVIMKKILFCLLICSVFAASAFARSKDNDDDSASEKKFGLGPGVRLSVLGVEPTLSLDIFNLELEGACAFSTGPDGKQFGYAPSFSVAYNTNPFEKGGFSVFGAEYMYLTPMYTNMVSRAFDKDEDEDVFPGIHAVSVFYKGGYNFNSVFGLIWRLRLPVMITGKTEEESFNLNITNIPGFAGCFLIGVCTTSIGVKLTF